MARLKNISRAREEVMAVSIWKDHRSQVAARPRIIQRALAGERQWIATTDFTGCPGRPLDSFANRAALTTPAKFLMGWAGPSPRAFLCRLTQEGNSFSPPMPDGRCRSATIRRPPFQSPQQELPESLALLDLPEYRLHNLHPQSVGLPTPLGL